MNIRTGTDGHEHIWIFSRRQFEDVQGKTVHVSYYYCTKCLFIVKKIDLEDEKVPRT